MTLRQSLFTSTRVTFLRRQMFEELLENMHFFLSFSVQVLQTLESPLRVVTQAMMIGYSFMLRLRQIDISFM